MYLFAYHNEAYKFFQTMKTESCDAFLRHECPPAQKFLRQAFCYHVHQLLIPKHSTEMRDGALCLRTTEITPWKIKSGFSHSVCLICVACSWHVLVKT